MRGILDVNSRPYRDIVLEDEMDFLQGEDAMDYVDRDANLEANLKRWNGHEPEVYMNEWRS